MNSPKKSPASKKNHNRIFQQKVARTHCLQILFGDLPEFENIPLTQLQDSIESALAQQDVSDSFERFCQQAIELRRSLTHSDPSYRIVHLDLKDKQWDPLFVHHQLVTELKKSAGYAFIFVLVYHLPEALHSGKTPNSPKNQARLHKASQQIEAIVQKWSTPSSSISLFYL